MDRWLRKERDILDIKKLNPKSKLIAKKYLGVKRSRYLTVKIIFYVFPSNIHKLKDRILRIESINILIS